MKFLRPRHFLKLILHRFINYLFLCFFLIFSSCALEEDNSQVPSPDNANGGFSSAEQRYISNIQSRGGLNVGLSLTGGVHYRDASGSSRLEQFNTAIAREFAKFLGVDIFFTTDLQFAQFFGDGSDIRPNLPVTQGYNPPAFSEMGVDVIAGFYSAIPWRFKFVDMVPILPNRLVFATVAGSGISGFKDVDGRSIAIADGLSYNEAIAEVSAELNVSPVLVPLADDESFLDAMVSGRAEATVADGIAALFGFTRDNRVQIVSSLSNLHYLNWLVEKDDELMAGLILKFNTHLQASGILNTLFNQYLGIQLQDYYSLIGFNSNQSLMMLPLTSEENLVVARLQERGSVVAATIESDNHYYRDENGELGGLQYELAINFAEMLGVDIEFVELPNFEAFFAVDGEFNTDVIEDPEIRYTPDYAEITDFYAGLFYITPWRQKLMDFITIAPTGLAIIGWGVGAMESPAELDGLTAAVEPGSHQQNIINELEEEYGISIDYFLVELNDKPITAVLRRDADFTIDGAAFIAAGMNNLDTLEIGDIVLDPGAVGWAVPKNDPAFASLLRKYIDYSLNSGTLGTLWEKHLGINFNRYLDILSSVF